MSSDTEAIIPHNICYLRYPLYLSNILIADFLKYSQMLIHDESQLCRISLDPIFIE